MSAPEQAPLAAPLLLLALALAAAALPAASAQNITDVDILNFALNLECLEAQFYSFAALGQGLSVADRGGGPAPRGGRKASLSDEAQAYAEEIAGDEIAHVRFLRAALGAAAVPCPVVDIDVAFALAADFAFGAILPIKFDAYASDVLFYLAAFIFEDVGVTAYKGAAPLITTAAYLEAAAGILAVEAYHAAIIRTKLYEVAGQTVFPFGATTATIAGAISALRNAAAGKLNDDQGIILNGTANLVPTDSNSIAFGRMPAAVRNIVQLGPAPGGGFFPKGLNGKIK